MNIYENKPKINNTALILEEVVSNGNIVPHNWYKELTNKRGDPDYSLICVLAEIVSSYRLQMKVDTLTNEVSYNPEFNSGGWQVSYAHFYNKFGFTRHKMRRVMERLEELNIAKREYRKVLLCGYHHRVLFIHLNLNYFKKSTVNNQSNSGLKMKDSFGCNKSDEQKSFKFNQSLSCFKYENSAILQICRVGNTKPKKICNQNNKVRSILSELINFYENFIDQHNSIIFAYISP